MFSIGVNCKENHNVKIGNRSFESVAQLKYLETTEMNQYSILEEIIERLNSGNVRYHSVQKKSPLPSKNIQIILYKTIILPSDHRGGEV